MIQVTLVNHYTDEAEQHLCNKLEVEPCSLLARDPKIFSDVHLFQGHFTRLDSSQIITTKHSFRVLAGKFLK